MLGVFLPAYFSSLGLSLSQLVTVALPGTACCLYTCISLRVFLLSPPPPPLSLSPLCLSVCRHACLTVCPSVCLSACLSVRFCLPPPPPPLSLFVPLFLHFPLSFPLCSVSPLFLVCFILVFLWLSCFVFSLVLFFFLWIFYSTYRF